MVFEIIWTFKALESFENNIRYLEKEWTQKEIRSFISTVEEKLHILSHHPNLGSARNKSNKSIRLTVLHKKVSLIYRVKTRKKQVELLRFWNTMQDPTKL